jgi:protoporphyrinogen oxidase
MIIIIGAGPAGLSAAYHLDSDFVVLEKEDAPGGLCRSFDLAGATFDLGGHAFFTRHQYVRDLLERLSETKPFTQPRRAWVYSHGVFVPYPFQMNLHGLPVYVVKDCLVGLYHAAAAHTDAPAQTLQEWIDRSFGEGISRHFLTSYNRKLWAFPLDEISPDWTSDRIVLPDIERIVAGALEDANFTNFVNATVSYPAEGGFFSFFAGFLPFVGDRLRRARVVRVNLEKRFVVTEGGGTLDYDYLISTMPLTELIAAIDDAPTCCRDAAATLLHNSLHLVNLVFARSQISDMQRVYAADGSIPFHKLVLNSNSSESLRLRPHFGIQAEVSFSPYKTVERAGLEQQVIEAVVGMGIITEEERPVATSVVTVRHAYPIYTKDTVAAREHLLSTLEEKGVYCAGRFGEWLYINSDDAIMRGMARAQEVNALFRS